MKSKEKKWLLDLARRSIKSGLQNEEFEIGNVSEAVKIKRACFVTLTKEGELRGCIGHLEASQALYLDVMENARAAAFEDPRFDPVGREEMDLIRIEISILSETKEYKYKNWQELVSFLGEKKPGVVLKKNGHKATFLPQVWEELTKAEEFLNYLCQKAGLMEDEWKRGVEIEIYEVEKMKEW